MTAGQATEGTSLRSGLPRKSAESVRASSLRHADAAKREAGGTTSGICLTFFGQEANATHLVSKRIGNAETCSRAKHALREYAIAISTSPVFVVTLPMPLLVGP